MRINFVNIAVNVLFCSLLWVSCAESQQKLICKTWKGAVLKNDRMDQEIAAMKTYIDTLGDKDAYLQKNFNTDSLKAMLRAEFEKSLQKQQTALESTRMQFRNDGKVISHSDRTTDTALYVLDGKNNILITETKGARNKLKYKILMLTRDTLKMEITESGETNIVTMIPARD